MHRNKFIALIVGLLAFALCQPKPQTRLINEGRHLLRSYALNHYLHHSKRTAKPYVEVSKSGLKIRYKTSEVKFDVVFHNYYFRFFPTVEEVKCVSSLSFLLNSFHSVNSLRGPPAVV